MILDPPRKGCDALFLDQLLDFSPNRIVYVSCWLVASLAEPPGSKTDVSSVQTQARDIGYILNHVKGKQYTVSESEESNPKCTNLLACVIG